MRGGRGELLVLGSEGPKVWVRGHASQANNKSVYIPVQCKETHQLPDASCNLFLFREDNIGLFLFPMLILHEYHRFLY